MPKFKKHKDRRQSLDQILLLFEKQMFLFYIEKLFKAPVFEGFLPKYLSTTVRLN